MATIQTDEVSFQINFYSQVFPNGLDDVNITRSTDGFTNNIIFEHKQNVTSYGKGKALSQALIYLARFNRDGIPIPAKICLVSQDESKCLISDTIDYVDYAFLNCKKPIFFRTDSVLSGYFDYYAFGVSKMLQKVAYKMQSIANSKITYMFAASKWVAECNRNNEQCVPEAKIKIVKTGANLSFDYIKNLF